LNVNASMTLCENASCPIQEDKLFLPQNQVPG